MMQPVPDTILVPNRVPGRGKSIQAKHGNFSRAPKVWICFGVGMVVVLFWRDLFGLRDYYTRDGKGFGGGG